MSTIDDLAKPFEVEHTCTVCGGAMLPAVSLWRCSKTPKCDGDAVGPPIGEELRLSASTQMHLPVADAFREGWERALRYVEMESTAGRHQAREADLQTFLAEAGRPT